MSLSSRIEVASNLATIVVAFLLSAALVKIYVLPASLSRPAAVDVRTGTSLKRRMPGIDWAKNRHTLVLVLSTQCHFCRESAPFYRKLAAAAARNLKTIALLPQPVPESQEYLSNEGIHVDEVRQAPIRSIGFAGTPSLLLVDGGGVVTGVWVGKLEPDQEAQVMKALRTNSGG